MAWVRLDDAMPHHPKVMAAGAEAFALDVAAIAYSNRFGTDGFIGDDMLPAVLPCLRSPRKAATRLCTVNRWMRDDERGGWLIHDVADYQPSAAEQEAERAKARERMRRLRAGSRSPEQTPNVRANRGRSSDDVPDPVPSRPNKKPLAADKPPRKPDPIFDAVTTACGIDPSELTDTGRGATNKAVKELRAIGATPDGIAARASVHLRKWPDATLTPSSLAKNYAQLGATPRGTPPGAGSPPEVGSEAWEERRRESEARASTILGDTL